MSHIYACPNSIMRATHVYIKKNQPAPQIIQGSLTREGKKDNSMCDDPYPFENPTHTAFKCIEKIEPSKQGDSHPSSGMRHRISRVFEPLPYRTQPPGVKFNAVANTHLVFALLCNQTLSTKCCSSMVNAIFDAVSCI